MFLVKAIENFSPEVLTTGDATKKQELHDNTVKAENGSNEILEANEKKKKKSEKKK